MATKEWKENNSEKLKKYRKEWYERNKENERIKAKERQSTRRKEFRDWFNLYKKNLKCEKCGFNHPAALDFHHLNSKEKEFNISQLKRFGNKEKLLKEIEKCMVLCSNCHRIHHFDEQSDE